MSGCDEVRAAALRGDPGSAEHAAHLAACASCREERAGLERLASALAAEATPAPPPGLVARTLAATAPLLDERARALRAPATLSWRRLALALAPAVLVLPVLVAADLLLLRGVYELLATLLPASLTAYLVGSYALLLAALLFFTFAAIPLLVQRQSAPSWKEGHV